MDEVAGNPLGDSGSYAAARQRPGARAQRRHPRIAAGPEPRIRSLTQRDLRCRAVRHVPCIPLITTNLIIAEVYRLTLFRAGRKPALRLLERIDASPGVTVHFATGDDHAAARRWLERLAPRPVTYTDAVSFAVVEATKCTQVLAFDQDFAAAGFETWSD